MLINMIDLEKLRLNKMFLCDFLMKNVKKN